MSAEDTSEDSDPNIDEHFTLGLHQLTNAHVADMALKSQEMLNEAIKGALLVINEDSIPDDE